MASRPFVAFVALASAACGVTIYLRSENAGWGLGALLAGVPFAVSVALVLWGAKATRKHPRGGAWLIEFTTLAVIALAAGVDAVLISLSVSLARALSSLSKENADAISSLLGGAILFAAQTILLDRLQSGETRIWPGGLTKSRFEATFKKVFERGSDAHEAVYEDPADVNGAIRGWGFRARHRRARVIAKELATRTGG